MEKNDFTKGYTCACAALVNMHGHTSVVTDLYRCNFHTEKELRQMGCEESDIITLLPVIKEIEQSKLFKNKS